jgi:serine phosphatase RsbU (regulator of sigma subunit)
MKPLIHWLFHKHTRWSHLQSTPLRQLALLLLGAFLLFSVIGFYMDLIAGGRLPYLDVLAIAAISGLNAALWVIAVSRLPAIFLAALVAWQFFIGTFDGIVIRFLDSIFHLTEPSPGAGLHFAATCILVVVILSYICFVRFMGMTGRETMRIRNELELAQGIQKTLVPPLHCTTASFEIYGISEPSERVGGDLVDVVELSGGDCVAYLADIAGHGLQAGILMGMLKTAARTALTGGGGTDKEAILSTLMHRLNLVLPQVKEAHMYATFTALRLNVDGQSFFGMAASTPLLHWKAAEGSMLRIEEQQFPLGLLPVSHFPASQLGMEAGDIVVIATDGILEVNSAERSAHGAEFGIEALEALVTQNATLPLPELAAMILRTVRNFGKQLDDQTLLLVRRRAMQFECSQTGGRVALPAPAAAQ